MPAPAHVWRLRFDLHQTVLLSSVERRTKQPRPGGKALAVAALALAGTLVSSPFSDSSSAWAAAKSTPVKPSRVVLVKCSAATSQSAWPSINGTMSTGFSASAAYDSTGLVAPSYGGWLADPSQATPLGRSFVARGQSIADDETITRGIVALSPTRASGASAPATRLASSAPLPPRRLNDTPEVATLARVPLPPRRPSGPIPEPMRAFAAVEETSRDLAIFPSADLTDEDPARENAAAPVENAARPIDDAAEPAASRPTAERGPAHIEALIARHAERYDIPPRLLRRVVWRESKFNPNARNGPYWGLMQIRVDTARGLGFRGAPGDLLDANTNLTYAAAYLANAYRVAGRDEKRAVMLYARGYYYEAKRKGMLGSLIRVASAGE